MVGQVRVELGSVGFPRTQVQSVAVGKDERVGCDQLGDVDVEADAGEDLLALAVLDRVHIDAGIDAEGVAGVGGHLLGLFYHGPWLHHRGLRNCGFAESIGSSFLYTN